MIIDTQELKDSIAFVLKNHAEKIDSILKDDNRVIVELNKVNRGQTEILKKINYVEELYIAFLSGKISSE